VVRISTTEGSTRLMVLTNAPWVTTAGDGEVPESALVRVGPMLPHPVSTAASVIAAASPTAEEAGRWEEAFAGMTVTFRAGVIVESG
jgi:hypothetical protein